MKVYVTKYALTRGIYQVEGPVSKYFQDLFIPNNMAYNASWRELHKDEWHTTKEAAVEKAKAMRDKKIVNLQKQIDRLKSLEF